MSSSRCRRCLSNTRAETPWPASAPGSSTVARGSTDRKSTRLISTLPLDDALPIFLTDDVFISMPPVPFEYEGRDAVARFCAWFFDSGPRVDRSEEHTSDLHSSPRRRSSHLSDGRCLHLDAAGAFRIRGPRRRGPLLRLVLRQWPEVR